MFQGQYMQYRSIVQRAAKWLAVASFLSFSLAMAQSVPSVDQVYAAAQAGKLEQAQGMIQQVLVAHPNSAKAHYVQSELYARQGQLGQARAALAAAEKLEPGLPFAKAPAVQALRAELAGRSPAPGAVAGRGGYAASVSSSPAWRLPLLLALGVIVLGYFLFRRRVPAVVQPGYGNPGGMNGPQTFTGPAGAMPTPYGQPVSSGLGGQIMGGVATGLAVGAGVMAAEAIGRDLLGNRNQPVMPVGDFGNNDYQNMAGNADMGGQDFGLNDAGSWDDGGSADIGGGWDN
jgi:tetratricopeptide (TPR) repeat protein